MDRNKIIHEYYHKNKNVHVHLRRVDLQSDLDQLYAWTHQPHVIPNWQLNKSKSELYKHFRKALEDRHQSLFIVSINNEEIGYAETYYALDDRLANFYHVMHGDYGLHLFIGAPHALGKGYSECILAALTDYLFTYKKAIRVLVEPNQNVKQLTILQRKMGFSNLGIIRLPEKNATLYAIHADDFYKTNPLHLHHIIADQNIISCDTHSWPIVKIHFGINPTDEAVISWLKKMDVLLQRQEPCVVISTFDRHYQFSTSARRHQALWFKKNTPKLAKYCIALVRVTRDQQMISKITSNAMRKGMPFICIPASSLQMANYIAQRLLKNNNKQTRKSYAA